MKRPCKIIQYSDSHVCARCDKAWDYGDYDGTCGRHSLKHLFRAVFIRHPGDIESPFEAILAGVCMVLALVAFVAVIYMVGVI